ncbi:MAG: ATP-binding cassette domain-containing protein [Neisseriaceae bacterium]|nr:MAG: ATP-binding cassette domain-containing protein [Neisseriaceae bacterium]
MIRFEQVVKTYPGGYRAIDNVSFTINQGEMIFIAGHSGAGKTTILKLVAGIIRPTSGKIWVNNSCLNDLNHDQLGFLRQHIGVIFQDHKILYDRTTLENVLLPLYITGYDKNIALRRANLAISKVGLEGKENVNPISLSGGEQQRLCIARAMVHQPGILIADEPSANLDRSYALDIMALFQSFHKAGTTLIISAHDESLMADYGHRIIRFKEGRFAA